MNYVYRVVNKINGKIYIGKRKHKFPNEDQYMGSGTLIKRAIEKYGKDSFEKEIIAIFETNEEAAALERLLVTKEFIASGNTYNMHEGGHGGFSHINSVPPDDRVNVKALKEKIKTGEIKTGGDTSMFFTEDSYRRIREGSEKGNDVLKTLPLEERLKINKKISSLCQGERNSQFGKRWCVREDACDLTEMISVFQIPEGYITTEEWKDRKKNKKSGCYGKSWYNDGTVNFFISQEDVRVRTLTKGRLVKKNSV